MYSFMNSGSSNSEINFETDDLFMLITLFTSNSITNAKRHIELCKRDVITKEDLRHGLIYETFEFLNNHNLQDEMDKIREQFNDSDDESDDDGEDVYALFENNIVPDEEIVPFTQLDKFEICKIPKKEDREFLQKLYKHYDSWSSWQPETPFEKILYSAINKTY
jgi:hypothetical protein